MAMQLAQDGVYEREARWPQGVTLLSQQMLPTMGPLLLVPVIPMILREYGAMPGAAYWVPSLITVPALCMALLSVVAGALGDKLGRRTPLIAALTVYGAAGIAPLFLTSFAAVFAARLMLGVCEALIVTLSMTMLTDYFSGSRRDRWLALFATVASGSAIILPALSGLLGAKFGWRAPTAIYGLALLVVPAMLALTWEARRRPEDSAERDITPFPWAHVFGVGVASLVGGSFFFIVAIQQAFGLMELGVTDPARIGLFTAISGVANTIGSLIFSRLVGVPTSWLLSIEATLIGGGLIAMGWSTSETAFAIAAFVASFGAGLLMPTLITWMVRGLPFAVRGRGVGIFQSLFSTGQFVSGLIVPFLARNVVHGALATFVLLGAISLALAVLAIARSLVPATAGRPAPQP